MSKEDNNKAIVANWFKRFWGNPYDESVVDELATDDVTVAYPMHGPRTGKAEVKKFMAEFREARSARSSHNSCVVAPCG